MNEAGRVRRFFGIIVAFNLLTLLGVFLAPRAMFIAGHPSMLPEAFLTTRGTRDLPNWNAGSFELAYALRVVTPPQAHLFLPPRGGTHTAPGPLFKVLLPRTLVFGNGADYKRLRAAAPLWTQSWLVSGPDWEPDGCIGRVKRPLVPDSAYVLCRLDGAPPLKNQDDSSSSNVAR